MLLLGFCFPAWSLQTYSIEKDKIKTIEVVGFNGDLSLNHNVSSQYTVQIEQKENQEVESWPHKVYTEDGVLKVVVLGSQSKSDWQEALRNKKEPSLNITVSGPSVPIMVSWRRGQLVSKNWQSSLGFRGIVNQLQILGGRGGIRANVQNGSVTVQNYEGSLVLEGFQAAVNIVNSKGDVLVNNFSGNTIVNQHDGFINLKSEKGNLNVSKGKGRIEFRSGLAPVSIDDFEGGIRGDAAQGAVKISAAEEVDLNVRSDKAAVDIQLKNSGAYLNIGTKDGVMRTAPYLKVTRYPNIKVIRGRLRGNVKGKVFVRSQAGDIVVR